MKITNTIVARVSTLNRTIEEAEAFAEAVVRYFDPTIRSKDQEFFWKKDESGVEDVIFIKVKGKLELEESNRICNLCRAFIHGVEWKRDFDSRLKKEDLKENTVYEMAEHHDGQSEGTPVIFKWFTKDGKYAICNPVGEPGMQSSMGLTPNQLRNKSQ